MTLLYLLILLAGLALIIYGANVFVDAAVTLSRTFGVSSAVIGLTVVAFGTSTPELAVSVSSAITNNADIVLGNVMGSNIFNILGILGICALVAPLKISKNSNFIEIPFMVISTILLLALVWDAFLGGGTRDVVTRGDSIAMLLFFILFMAYTFYIARFNKQNEAPRGMMTPAKRRKVVIISILILLAGLVLLVAGSRVFMYGATALVQKVGISEAIVGIVFAAVGTSIPELVTSLVAVRKGHLDIAVGNVVGSNIFNILFITGVSALVRPIAPSAIGNIDYLALLISAFMLFAFAHFFGDKRITRVEGLIMLLTYIGYLLLLILK